MGIKYVFNPTTGNLDATSVETPAGSDTQIQFNDAGSFGGDVDLTWNKTTNVMTVAGDVNLSDGGSFTTTLQTITPTANRTVSIPDATGTLALVAGSSGQLLYNNAGANAGVSTMTFDGTSVTLAGRLINSYTSVASSPAKVFTGTWFTGGTATTTKPHFLIEPTGTTSTAWSTSGTGLGVNAASGFAGNLLDLQLNGTSRVVATGAGRVGIGTTTVNRQLVLNDNTLACLALQNSTTGNAISDGFQIQLSGTDAYIWNYETAPIAFGTNSVERARIDSSGRLLVGTVSSPSAGDGQFSRLVVQGSVGGSTSYVAFARNAAATAITADQGIGLLNFTDNAGNTFGRVECYADANAGSGNYPGRLVFSTTADGAASPTERLRITSAGVLQVADAGNIAVGTTTGTKIGTATTQKLGFFNKTPVVQPAAVADATDAASVITQLNALLARMRDLGLIAT